MVWKGIRVVRVLKGAHQGIVGDICVIEEASQCLIFIRIRLTYLIQLLITAGNHLTYLFATLGRVVCFWRRKGRILDCIQLRL